jgi:hypothetical protein
MESCSVLSRRLVASHQFFFEPPAHHPQLSYWPRQTISMAKIIRAKALMQSFESIRYIESQCDYRDLSRRGSLAVLNDQLSLARPQHPCSGRCGGLHIKNDRPTGGVLARDWAQPEFLQAGGPQRLMQTLCAAAKLIQTGLRVKPKADLLENQWLSRVLLYYGNQR